MEIVKETINARIHKLIKQKGYKSLLKFHEAIVKQAGKDAISHTSLRNLLTNKSTVNPHEKTLSQIATILKIHVYDLIKGTNIEPASTGESSGYIQLNDTATLYNFFTDLSIQPQLLKVEQFGESPLDGDKFFFDGSKPFRFIYVVKGSVDLILKHKDKEQERKELKKGDAECFSLSIPHYFKNNNPQYAEILITNFKQSTPYE